MVARPVAVHRRLIRSAGALVWRPVKKAKNAPPGTPLEPSDIEVLLVHRPRYKDWSWPKGKTEHNEPIAQAAVREVEEETGELVYLQSPLTIQRYRLGSGHTKEVHYWAAQAVGDQPAKFARPPVHRATKKEIDEARWCKPGRARQLLTRRGDRRLLAELLKMGARGELTSSSIILLRHAKARSRDKWDQPDGLRPLTRVGGMQALDLPPLLSAFGADHLISSPWTRCVQTVGPYSSIARLDVKLNKKLTEDSVAANPQASSALVEKLLKKDRGVYVVSHHSPGLPPLLEPLIRGAGSKRYPVLSSPHKGLRTSEMFIAHIAHPLGEGPKVLNIERHIPYTRLAGH